MTAMPSPTRSNHRRIVGLVLSGLMGALLVVSKQAMSGLPNIEPVTLLIILFALELPRETPAAITVFILLQGVLYGFGLWWAMYLYIWYLLALLAWLFRRIDHALFWAVFSGLYGLCFGGLCAAVYLFAKTPAFALSWWLSGLSYDALHGVGNFAIMLVLYRPLRKALKAAKRQIGYLSIKAFPRGGSRSFPKVSLSHEREAFLFTTYGRNCNFMVYYIG